MVFVKREPRPLITIQDEARVFSDALLAVEHFREGYPRLSAYINSDKQFVAFRRFGQVHARILLHKQSVISKLEEKLNTIDEEEVNTFRLKSWAADDNTQRAEVLAELEIRLVQYDSLLGSYLRNCDLPQAQPQNITSITNWVRGNKPLSMDESTFLRDWGDLVGTQQMSTRNSVETLVESFAGLLHGLGLRRLFANNRDLRKSHDDHIIYITPERVTIAARLLAGLFAAILSIIPIVVLYNMSTLFARLEATAISASLFAMFIALTTHARLIEVFSTTATYCSVLVVFLSYMPQPPG